MLPRFFEKDASLRDFLDGLTIYCRGIAAKHSTAAVRFRDFVRRVFEEENLDYRIDDKGVVHPFVDVEFEVNRSAALEALNSPRFGESRSDFEAAFRHLRNSEGKAAIRSMFPAVGTSAKMLCPGAMTRLMPNEVDRHFAEAAPGLRG